MHPDTIADNLQGHWVDFACEISLYTVGARKLGKLAIGTCFHMAGRAIPKADSSTVLTTGNWTSSGASTSGSGQRFAVALAG